LGRDGKTPDVAPGKDQYALQICREWSAEAERFLEKARSTLEQQGFSFSWALYGAD